MSAITMTSHHWWKVRRHNDRWKIMSPQIEIYNKKILGTYFRILVISVQHETQNHRDSAFTRLPLIFLTSSAVTCFKSADINRTIGFFSHNTVKRLKAVNLVGNVCMVKNNFVGVIFTMNWSKPVLQTW